MATSRANFSDEEVNTFIGLVRTENMLQKINKKYAKDKDQEFETLAVMTAERCREAQRKSAKQWKEKWGRLTKKYKEEKPKGLYFFFQVVLVVALSPWLCFAEVTGT